MAEGGVTAETVEKVADVVENVGEEVVQAAEIVRNLNGLKIKFALLGAACGTAAGALIGFKVAFKKAELKYKQIADEDTEQVRAYYLAKEAAKEDQQKPPLGQVVQDLGYATKEAPPAAIVQGDVTVNTFDVAVEVETPEWDFDTEMKSRTASKPYVIHRDEFMSPEAGEGLVDQEQMMLTYFAGDEVLCDERDTVIDNKDELVGVENLERFGHGSLDPTTVYVRNRTTSTDYEIHRSDGKFAHEVQGFTEDELRHSDGRRHRPDRRFDDD